LSFRPLHFVIPTRGRNPLFPAGKRAFSPFSSLRSRDSIAAGAGSTAKFDHNVACETTTLLEGSSDAKPRRQHEEAQQRQNNLCALCVFWRGGRAHVRADDSDSDKFRRNQRLISGQRLFDSSKGRLILWDNSGRRINLSLCSGGGCGTVFRLTPEGTLTTLYSFCSQPDCADGTNPYAGLVQGKDGNFYGTTYYGGLYGTKEGQGNPGYYCAGFSYGCGTIFKITPQGELTSLYSFCSQFNCNDGVDPAMTLVEGRDGSFYGTTSIGGPSGNGTVFKVTTEGKFNTIYSFCPHHFVCSHGSSPSGLVQGADGDLYGVTYAGGACLGHTGGCGTVFKISETGHLKTLYVFCASSNCPDGYGPEAALVQDNHGNFYGSTSQGGRHNFGTIFRVTPKGKLTTLYSICPLSRCPDGAGPNALIPGTDGKLYGTMSDGGLSSGCVGYGCGTIFEMTPEGKLTTIYDFCSQPDCSDGANPLGGLLQSTNGTFYGLTENAGTSNLGTLFSFSPGLDPSVMTPLP
jgi:uncharacterized repeat protein (TIGR03803 family)